jgi:hypothetical protein
MAGQALNTFTGSAVTKNSLSGIESGYAGWYRFFYTFRKASLEAGYWRSHNFFAPDGNYIFGSVSDHINDLVIADRKLITGSANITLLPGKFFEVYLGFDGYYDTDLKRFDTALSLHLRFNQLIKIAELKR